MIAMYSMPIVVAVIVLLFIGFFAVIPWLIHSYRKYRFLSFWNTFIIVSFVFYALSAYFLVILPLPEVRDTCAMQGPDAVHFQPIPFYFLYEMITGSPIVWSKLSSYIHLIKHPSFLPAFFNILILLPLGIYMRYFRWETLTMKRMIMIGFLVSLFFETTQITGLYGIYNCPYRTFNVDDLILNTLGAAIGYVVAPAILALLPSKESLQQKSERISEAGFVQPIPRLLALLVDYLIVSLSWTLISKFFSIDDPMIKIVWLVFGLLVVQYLIPVYIGGRTPGTKILRFHLVKDLTADKLSRVLFKRWLALIVPFIMFKFISLVAEHSTLAIDSPYYTFQVFLVAGLILLQFMMILIFAIHGMTVLFSRSDKSFYFDKISRVSAHYDQRNNETEQ